MARLFERNGRWGIDFINPNGRRIREMVSEYREAAEAKLKQTEVDIARGIYVKNKMKAIKFSDFVEEFLKNYIYLENRRPKNSEGRIRKIAVWFKGKYLHEITPRTIRQYLSQVKEVSKPATVNRHLSMLRCFFNRAIEWGILDGVNPTKGIKKLPELNERHFSMTDEQRENLLAQFPKDQKLQRLAVLTALFTGLRWSEVMSLRWERVNSGSFIDFNRNVIVVHSSNTKGKKAREIPMCYRLQCELFDLKKQSQYEYVFANPETKKPFNNIRKAFLSAVKKAGLRGMTFHSLRHCFGSRMIAANVNGQVLQQLLGHSSYRMTQRYCLIEADQFQSAINKIDLQSTQNPV